jgi:subtilisin family serine protease
MPVTWVGPPPTRRRDKDLRGARRPVVAVLDTGTGTHPWLTDKVVDRAPTCAYLRIGLTDPATDIEQTGVGTGQLTGSLDIEAGHGTFIAGLVHQRCPDAKILSIRVVQTDGVVSEYDLLQAVNMLWLRQKLALKYNRRNELVDVISMSLGYYHEDESDARFDPLMLAPLRALSRLGVAVVVSAGNDATKRPIYPAAFAPYPGGVVDVMSSGEVPLVAVGATNPDGSIALFSNDGPWVRAYRPGAGLVSTMPTTFDAGQKASVEVYEDGQRRSTIDPDNYLSGFATWSGTSFAAPILAGDLAQCMNEDRALRMDPAEDEDPVRTAWTALHRAVPSIEEPR